MLPLNEYGFTDFRREILKAAPHKISCAFYFSQSACAYYADYRPYFPNKNTADFTICLLFGSAAPRLTVYQQTALLPTIKQYRSMDELRLDLEAMEQ